MDPGETADGGALETRRVAAFLVFAFGIAWTVAFALWRTGGLGNSPVIAGSGPLRLTLAAVLLPTVYMFAPGAANLLTRRITDEGRDRLLVRPRPIRHWRSYVTGWVMPPVLTLAGAALFFAAFPRYFDPAMTAFADALAARGGQVVDPRTVVVVQLLAAVSVAPLINGVPAVGEEFGWRGYLLPKLSPLGLRRAIVLHGVVWGVWHWPLIAMGYEYGFGYPLAPVSGLLVFPVFTVSVGAFLAWLTLRSESVWPATLAHGAVNAVAGIGIAFVRGSPNPLLGPLPVGLVGGLPWIVLAGYLLARTDRTGSVAFGSPAEPRESDAADSTSES